MTSQSGANPGSRSLRSSTSSFSCCSFSSLTSTFSRYSEISLAGGGSGEASAASRPDVILSVAEGELKLNGNLEPLASVADRLGELKDAGAERLLIIVSPDAVAQDFVSVMAEVNRSRNLQAAVARPTTMIRISPKRTSRKPENTIALINVVFLMLIFFLVAGTLAPSPDHNVDFITLATKDPAALPVRYITFLPCKMSETDLALGGSRKQGWQNLQSDC